MSIPQDILNDLGTRFLIHLPQEEKQDPTRLCFQMEQAFWFYLDFYAGEGTSLPNVSMKTFTNAMFKNTPGLKAYAKRTDEILDTWKQFKLTVPTYGCILVDTSIEYCLLVQGYCSRGTWGFPKGKVNENEKPHLCAGREVLEETGFDCSHLIDKKVYLERKFGDNLQRLYIVPGVSRDTLFLPQTRKEIRSIRWFHIRDLPTCKADTAATERTGLNTSSFFMVYPFVKPLRSWMEGYRRLMRMAPLGSLPIPIPIQSAFQPFAADSPLALLAASVSSAVPMIPTAGALPITIPGMIPTMPMMPLIQGAIPGYSATAATNLMPTVLSSPSGVECIETLITKKTSDNNDSTITTVKTVISKKKDKKKPETARKSLDRLFENIEKLSISDQNDTVVVVAASVKSTSDPTSSPKREIFTPFIYKAPTLTVPAWTNFKLNYKEYVDLVQ